MTRCWHCSEHDVSHGQKSVSAGNPACLEKAGCDKKGWVVSGVGFAQSMVGLTMLLPQVTVLLPAIQKQEHQEHKGLNLDGPMEMLLPDALQLFHVLRFQREYDRLQTGTFRLL